MIRPPSGNASGYSAATEAAPRSHRDTSSPDRSSPEKTSVSRIAVGESQPPPGVALVAAGTRPKTPIANNAAATLPIPSPGRSTAQAYADDVKP